MPENRKSVAVVGAGVAGLSAAVHAARAGCRVTVFESVSRAGGRARTTQEEGFHFNMGPHALYRGGAAQKVLDSLEIELRAGSPRLSGALARYGGTLHALPAGPVSLLRTGLLRVPEKLEFGRFLGRVPRLDTASLEGLPFSTLLEREIRNPKVREVVAAFLRLSTYSNAPDEICAAAATQQLALALKGVRYLDAGWQQMVDALLAVAQREGVTLHTRARVKSLEQAESLHRLCLADGSLFDCGSTVLAMGPGEAAALVESPQLKRAAQRAVPVRAACLDLGLARLPNPRRGFVLGIDEAHYFSLHSTSAQLAPPGGALVHVARYLAPGEEPSLEEIETELESLVDALQPGWREHVVARRLMRELRVSHGLVRADDGGLAGRQPVGVEDVPGLFVAGDWVGSEGQLADASFASGHEAGNTAAARPG